MAVASDAFNGTLLILFFLLYEYALSFLLSFDHRCRLLVYDYIGTNAAKHDAATALPDHE